jgi:hypothetical protein
VLQVGDLRAKIDTLQESRDKVLLLFALIACFAVCAEANALLHEHTAKPTAAVTAKQKATVTASACSSISSKTSF